jgi:hypothetical protein
MLTRELARSGYSADVIQVHSSFGILYCFLSQCLLGLLGLSQVGLHARHSAVGLSATCSLFYQLGMSCSLASCSP